MLKKDFKELKKIINDYYIREFGEDCTINNTTLCENIKDLGLAYTTTEDGEHEIQVSTNLLRRIVTYSVDGKLKESNVYLTWKEYKEFLDSLDFDEMIYDCEVA